MNRLFSVAFISLLVACSKSEVPSSFKAPVTNSSPPIVQITTHQNNETITIGRFIILGGTVESENEISSVTVQLNGINQETSYENGSFAVLLKLGNRDNMIRVSAKDVLGKESETVQIVLRFPFITFKNGQAAERALGQADLTSNIQVNDENHFIMPIGNPFLSNGVLWVPDSNNHRVMRFGSFDPLSTQISDGVVGQADLQTFLSGNAPDRMNQPRDVKVYGDKLFVVDRNNHRVMIWNSIPESNRPADVLLGQIDPAMPDLTSSRCSDQLMKHPASLCVSGEKLIVSDTENNRVLVWNQIPTVTGQKPDVVIGQRWYSRCMANDLNQDGLLDPFPSEPTLFYPLGVACVGEALYVADSENGRVMIWDQVPTTNFQFADRVLGKPNLTDKSEQSLSNHHLVRPAAIDSNGVELAVAEGDQAASRVLIWNRLPEENGEPASVVLGQSTFNTGYCNDANGDLYVTGPEASSMCAPGGVQFSGDKLFVSDSSNHRILIFGDAP